MHPTFDDFRVTGFINESTHGRASVSLVKAGALETFRSRGVRAGDVATSLTVNNRLLMSDTRDEWSDHWEAINKASGRVLIHGLGLGCYLKAILTKPEVTSVDVVELEADVLALIGPYYASDPRVHLHHGDAYTFTFPQGATWDVAWHDIWADKCTDDLDGHARLNRRYGRKVGWQGCWAHPELVSRRRWEKTQWWSR